MRANSLLLVEATFVLTVMAQSDEYELVQIVPPPRLWNRYQDSNGNYIVPYQFDSSYNYQDRHAIVTAMETIAAKTCIEFRPRTNEEDYIKFVNWRDVGCKNKYHGRAVGENPIFHESSDVRTCNRGEGILSLLFSLGIAFEDERVDRDKYIRLHLENLADPEKEAVFGIEEQTTYYISVPYDYHSITHHAKDAFAKVGTITIETLDPAFQDIIGQTDEPSAGDYAKINVLYGCIQP